jgi:CheY-like chemotaxis protein/cytochrome c-type biogenesis protein CcmH/NrfG
MAFTVLLVDDDPVARSAMERAILDDARLRPLGPRVVQGASGEQGLAMFVNDRPQVIITDLIMAGMDGFAFCRAVREAPFGKDVGLIVISGIYRDPSLAVSLDRDVRAAFLSKPFSQAEIAEAVLACLRAPGQAMASTGNATPQPQASTPAPIGEGRGVPSGNTPRPVVTGFRATTPGPTRPVGTNPGRTTTPGPIVQPATTPHPTATPDPSGTLRFFPPGASSRASAGLSGSLAERGVPKLLFDLTDGSQTGTLALNRGKMRKEIYLRDGKVVGADSNLRQEALGTLLCAKGIIDERQLTYLLAETKARGHKMGAVLIELGWLSPEDVLQCLAAQVRKRLTDCLRWDEGNWSFVPGDNFGDRIIEHDLEVERIIFMGLLRSATPEKLIGRFDQNGASEVRLTRRFDHHRSGFEAVFGADITRVLATGASVGSLALRDDSHLIITAIDTLLETGLAELSDPAQEPEQAPVPNAWQASLSLEKLGAEIGNRIDAIRTESPDELFSPVPRTATPSPEEQDSFSQVADEQDSGAMDVSLRAMRSTPADEGADSGPLPPGRDSPSEALRQAILRTYLTIHGKPLYEALGVSRDAPAGEVVAACAAKSAEFSPTAVAGLQLSVTDQAKLESVRAAFDRAARILANPQLRQNYDRTLASTLSAEADPLGAELAFGEALRLFNADKVAESLPKFEAAVRARSDQALYHAYLGWAQFVAFGAQWAGAARNTLNHALALDPDLPEAHAMLGRLAATENDAATARKHLERSLELEPIQPEVVELLLQAYQRLNDPKGAEGFMRKLIGALGDRAQPLRRRLWCELATVYENQLADQLSARIAYDMAARLAPDDIDILKKSAEMNAEDPTRWRETARAITAEWQLHPEDGRAGERLVDLFLQQGRKDAAGIAAAAMLLRGSGDDRIAKLAGQSRPAVLHRISSKLPADWPGRLGYSSEFADVESLIALLVDSGVLPPVTIAEVGLDSEAPVLPNQQPALFRPMLRYLCELLEIREPRVLPHPALLGEARMAHLQPPALLCGSTLLKNADSLELGFRLARALALATTGRLAGSVRSGGQLRPYLMAALATARGSLRSEGPAFEGARDAIAALDEPARTRIAESSQHLARKYGSINLTAWAKGLGRLALRLSLLICADLPRVGRAVAEEEGPAALDDLLAFALSFDYLDLSEEIHGSST